MLCDRVFAFHTANYIACGGYTHPCRLHLAHTHSLGNIGVLRVRERIMTMIYRDKEDDDAVLPEEAVSELLDGDEDENEKVDPPEEETEKEWE